MGVVHQTGVIAVTAGEGDGPDAATLAAALAGTPAITYGTTNSSGTSSTLLRTDDQIKYPTALMSAANSSTVTLTDDATNQTLTGSLGDLYIQPLSGRSIFLDPQTKPGGNVTATVRVFGESGASQAGLQTQYIATALSAASTVRGWNISMSHSSQMVSSTIVGYDMTTFSVSPGASSDTANFMYGARLIGPTIGNATGGFTEVAGITVTAPKRIVSNPTVTAAYGIITTCPTVSATLQVGIHIRQNGAQQAATDRYGILCDGQISGTNRYDFRASGMSTGTPTNCYGYYADSHAVGTNRWSYWGSNKFHCDASDFIANASAFGFCNRDSQSSSAGGGGTARYWRMYTDASATGVSGDVTIAIDSAGNMTATRAGGAAGTVLLKLVDVGTAAVTT